jgi:hypothetical protein
MLVDFISKVNNLFTAARVKITRSWLSCSSLEGELPNRAATFVQECG